MTATTQAPHPKLTQYLEELNTLNDKYQYIQVAKIKVTDTGIAPYISLIDKIPPKEATKPVTTQKRTK